MSEIKGFKDIIDKGREEKDNSILKTFKFGNFNKSIEFVNKVAEIAENNNHHPDILIQFNKVTLELTSHDAGSVITEKDINLAKEIENINNN